MKSLTKFFFAAFVYLAPFQVALAQQPVSRITCYVEIDARTTSRIITDFSQFDYLDIAFTNPDRKGFALGLSIDTLIDSLHKHHKKVLATIGGKDWHSGTSLRQLISESSRAQFIQQIVAFLDRHSFDGVDIDFEGGLVNSDFEPFIRALHAALDGEKVKKELTLAVGGDDFMKVKHNDTVNVYHIPPDFWNCVDFVNTMSYDETSKHSPPHQDASWAYAVRDLSRWINVMKVPRNKLGLGLPFYGQQFGHPYKDEVGFNIITTQDQGDPHADFVALPDGGSIYYNGLTTIAAKTQYACSIGIKGIMVWQVTEDVPGQNSLLAAITLAIKTYKPPGQ